MTRNLSYIVGVGLTRFGEHPGRSTLDLMSDAATEALADAGFERGDVDGLICGYSTTLPHLMLSSLFASHFGLAPTFAHSIQVGGATGAAMVAAAHNALAAGAARRILVVAGENRLTGAGRDAAMHTLAQVGHAEYEVPLGLTIPAYYALIASRYMHDHAIGEHDLAELAVLMRAHAARHPGAHMRSPLTIGEVLASRPIATPLKLLDCCPVSDGAAAVVVAREPPGNRCAAVLGAGQAHLFLHVSEAPADEFGAGVSARAALADSGVALREVAYLAVYDSFTITLAILLEEIGFAPRGQAGALARAGAFGGSGELPLNTHGGLLSYGHCGVAGAMAHLVEAHLQLTGRAGDRQAGTPEVALLHGDGGVLSSHVTLVLGAAS
jgi:acetyl-CoA acetyltransferase